MSFGNDSDYRTKSLKKYKLRSLRAKLLDDFPYSIASLGQPVTFTTTLLPKDIWHFLREVSDFVIGGSIRDQEIKRKAYMVLFTHILRSGLAEHLVVEKYEEDCVFTQSVREANCMSRLPCGMQISRGLGALDEFERRQAGQALWKELMKNRPFSKTGNLLPKAVVLKILEISIFPIAEHDKRERAITHVFYMYPDSLAELETLSKMFGHLSTPEQVIIAKQREAGMLITQLHFLQRHGIACSENGWKQELMRLRKSFMVEGLVEGQSLSAQFYRDAILEYLLGLMSSAFQLDLLAKELGYKPTFPDVMQVLRGIERRFQYADTPKRGEVQERGDQVKVPSREGAGNGGLMSLCSS